MLITESSSHYDHLENMTVAQILEGINNEDKTVAHSVEKAIPQIELLVTQIVERMEKGGRIFYIGAGTSGRLGVVDASECPPTFGVPHGVVVGLIAGGDAAIRKAVENAEDDPQQAWIDLAIYDPNPNDTLIGIAASGTTPYVIAGIKKANENGLLTGCVTCNAGTPLGQVAQYPIEAVAGPEFVTGSTRMKAGTAQKMVLNMITTSVMIRLGRVKGNKMVDMQLSNIKLVDRGTKMVMNELGIDYATAEHLLQTHGSVRKAVDSQKSKE